MAISQDFHCGIFVFLFIFWCALCVRTGSLDLNAAPQITAATQRLPLLMPMLQGQKVMQCFLPSEYKSVADAAVPTNSAIIIRTIPERVVAVMKFRGKFEVQNHAERLSKFRDLLRKERLLQNTKDPDAQLGQQSSLTTINETCPLLIPEAPLNPPSSESATDAVPQNEVTSVVQPGHWTVAYYFTPGESVCCQKIELWVDVDRNCPEVLKWFPQH